MHKFSLIKMHSMFDLKVIERSRSFENVKNEFSTLKLVELHVQHVSVCHIELHFYNNSKRNRKYPIYPIFTVLPLFEG